MRARWCIRRTARTSSCIAISSGVRWRIEFAKAEHQLSFRATWNRNATVPIETFAVAAQWHPGTEILDIWASIQMPKYPDQAAKALRLPGNAVRVHYDVDVGGSYGVKRGHQAHRAGRVPGEAARLSGAPDRGPAGKHARRRHARSRPDVRHDRRLRRRRHRPRAEDPRHRQCRRLCRPRAVPARQAGERDLRSLSHRRDRLRADLGDDQQDAAGSGARLRPGADQFRAGAHHGSRGAVPEHGPDRVAAKEPDPQGRVSVHHPERLDLRFRRLSRRPRQGAGGDRLPGAGYPPR